MKQLYCHVFKTRMSEPCVNSDCGFHVNSKACLNCLKLYPDQKGLTEAEVSHMLCIPYDRVKEISASIFSKIYTYYFEQASSKPKLPVQYLKDTKLSLETEQLAQLPVNVCEGFVLDRGKCIYSPRIWEFCIKHKVTPQRLLQVAFHLFKNYRLMDEFFDLPKGKSRALAIKFDKLKKRGRYV